VQAERKYDGVDGPRVAIAHDYLTQLGGAEKIVLSMSRAFPEAPIYTMLYDPETTYPEFAERDVRVSAANKFAPLRKHHRVGLPIYPLVAQSVFIDADVRWLYLSDKYLGAESGLIKRSALALTRPYLKAWDRRQALAADKYYAISTLIKGRIADTYGIDAEVMFAPVAMSQTFSTEPIAEMDSSGEDFYLVVSRLLPYKNVDVIVRAFAGSDRKLVVVGKGPDDERLREMKTPNVLMLSDLTDGQMAWLYKNCRALIAASYEDYGLTPIEAGVWGRPSVALRFGGFLDTIDEGVTGMYFDEPEPRAIADALDRFEAAAFDPDKIRRHVEQFTEDVFTEKLHTAVDKLAAVDVT
jgi:glycosyltransferase involved in cell wall biosynthesis